MRPMRSIAAVAITAASLVLTAGVAQALTDEILLTPAEAQAAASYPGALSEQPFPAGASGMHARLFKGGEFGLDTFGDFVFDEPSGEKANEDKSKKALDDQIETMKKSFPALECKMYENAPPRFTMVCWDKDPVLVMGISVDVKTYYHRVKVKKRWKKVVWKQITVMGTDQHILPEADSVSEADKDRAAAEAKGIRNAQMAKMPAKYS